MITVLETQEFKYYNMEIIVYILTMFYGVAFTALVHKWIGIMIIIISAINYGRL